VAAGVKVSTLVSAIADGPKRIALYAEKTNELKTLKLGPWIKDRILLIDLGFYKHQIFARIEENGGFFVSRLKKNADPFIIKSHNRCRGNSIDVAGKSVSEVIAGLYRARWDIELIFKELKSRYALDVVNTTNPQIVETHMDSYPHSFH